MVKIKGVYYMGSQMLLKNADFVKRRVCKRLRERVANTAKVNINLSTCHCCCFFISLQNPQHHRPFVQFIDH